MNVLFISPSFYPANRYGGPIQSVLHLCQALLARGVDVRVFTTDADGPKDLSVSLGQQTPVEGVPVTYFHRWPRLDYAFSLALAGRLRKAMLDVDIVHMTSTFSFPTLVGSRLAAGAGKPYVISPRGSLQRWSLAQKRWKKVPYFALIERGNLQGAAAIHATSEIERDELRAVLDVPIFVVPNGVELPDLKEMPKREPKRIVFLGRVHQKKGLDILVAALSLLDKTVPATETLIAGPDDNGEWGRIEKLLASMQPRPHVRYLGPLEGEERFRFLGAASVFVLPSHSENFGQAVVEALACGTPVVVSRNCPWRRVEEAGAGRWVENTPEGIASGLASVLRDESDWNARSSAAKTLAAEYSWSSMAGLMQQEYETILRRGRPPLLVEGQKPGSGQRRAL
jgi:glycosyltransferase involved in cell wall biosynthesis